MDGETFQPLGLAAAAVIEKCCAKRAALEPSPDTLHRRSVAAVQAQRTISREIDKLVAARTRAEAAKFLREKLEQIEG